MTGDADIGEDRLQAYVDGRLDGEAQARVEAYLQANPQELARIAAYGRQRDGLRAALAGYAGRPPAVSVAGLLAARRVTRRAARWAPWRMAAAIAVILALGGGGGWVLRGVVSAEQPGGIAALTQAAIENHLVYTADYGHPVEMASDHPEGLVHWLSGRLNRQLRVPDLHTAGYQLMGGRLVAADGGPAALLMYDDAHGTRLTIFARPVLSKQDTRTITVGGQPVGGYAWICGGLGYVVLASTEAQDLRVLATLVRQQVDPI
jgi:anti-sigma factor RsiW